MELLKRRPADIALGFFLLSHQLPVLLHICAVTLFALLAAWPTLAWGSIVLVVAAHAAMQLSIAMLNDYCDRGLDMASRPDKPIVRGLVRPGEALAAGLLMIVIMLLLLLPLPRLALLISLAYLFLGQAYNLGLKSTPLSGLLFALAMPLIPLYAFAAFNRPLPLLAWLVPAGALLGMALNLANALPDIEEDAAHGARTLAVTLGARRSFFVAQFLVILCTLLIGLLTWTHLVPARPWLAGGGAILSGLTAIVILCIYHAGLPTRLRKPHFYIVVAECLLLAGCWLSGVLF